MTAISPVGARVVNPPRLPGQSDHANGGSRYLLGPVDQIPYGEGRTFLVDGEQVAVFRLRDGSVRAIGAVCPHQGGPLADGTADARVVICPLHANTFELATGRCLTGAPDVPSYSVVVDEDNELRLIVP